MTDTTKNQDSAIARSSSATVPPCGPVTELTASHAGNASSGAPPSNTAPANYIDGSTCIFRTGIDSLYLSWAGMLNQEYDDLLIELRDKARSSDPIQQSEAILQIFDHRFEVSDKGKGNFPFVLRDNWFHIQLSRTHSKSMPMALVQIKSEVLSKSGYIETVQRLEYVISQLGKISDQKISRIDICADFYTDFDLEYLQKRAWVMQAGGLDVHHPDFNFSGYSFGNRGKLSGRLYNKAIEIEKSGKTFFYDLWKEGGWLGELPVMRLEFQFRRQVLKEMGVNSTKRLDEKLNGLWQYCCQKWLRLTLPSQTDTARSRWPDHPLWIALKDARFGTGDLKPLNRTRKERLPSQKFLYVNGLGAITSFMASEGITDLNVGYKAYLRKAAEYHRTRRASGNSLGTYIKAKILEKARKFNTRLKPDPKDTDPDTYRNAKEGE